MAKQRNIELFQDTDDERMLTVTKAGLPFDLTDVDISLLCKQTVRTPDEDADFVYEIGSGITVTDATAGEAIVAFDRTDVADAGKRFYRINLTVDSKKRLVAYGSLITIDV